MERIQTSNEAERQPVKLSYIGKMDVPGFPGDLRLWNIMTVGHKFYRSSRTLDGLRELGIVAKEIL